MNVLLNTACFFFFASLEDGVLRLVFLQEDFWIANFSSIRPCSCPVCSPPKFIVFEKGEITVGGHLT